MTDTLKQVGDDYWEWLMRTDPTGATYLADYRYNDRLPDISPSGLSHQRGELRSLAARLRALHPPDVEDAISSDILGHLVDNQIEERSHSFEQWNLDQLYGPQLWLLEVPNYHPLRDEKDYHDLATRYRAFGPYIASYIENLGAGVRSGRTAPYIARDRVLGQLRDSLATATRESPLLPAVSSKADESMDSQARERGVRDVLNAVEDVVYPAFQSLFKFLETYPARLQMGIWALPDGQEAYEYRIRRHTTTELTAKQIHELGLELLESLHKEMKAVARRVSGNDSLVAFSTFIRQDPANFFQTRNEVLAEFRRQVGEIEGVLEKWFGRLPAVHCEVKAIEEFRERDAVAAYYYPPPDDFSRPGVFYANTYKPYTRPRYNMAALTAHEAVPGHHLQIALAMEQRDLPNYRRHSDFTAYIEGWALYAERLAHEMGLYKDDLSYFGMLTYQAWRATRLVVDTGIHAMRWDRERAIQFFMDNVGLPEDEIANEVDRYIVWPGQALAYSVGMSEIMRLRRIAEQRLGSRFDLRAFHDAVLRGGAVPLSTLGRIVDNHIASFAGVA